MKIEQCCIVHNKKVFLGDIAKLYCSDPNVAKEAGQICVMTVKGIQNESFIFSIMKIIDLIGRSLKNVDVVNIGEKDFIINYEMPQKPNRVLEYTKAVIVALIVFFGSAFTIMTFNEDASVGKIFESTYALLGAESLVKYKISEISYSVGLCVGILVFFNHFSKQKATADPTPLQIEMKNYEKEINNSIISAAQREGRTRDV